MNSFILALQFLTRIPIPYETTFNPREAGKSLAWFPLISAFMGLCVAMVQGLFFHRSQTIAGVLALFTLYFLNGGLHLDGLADTADGFLSNRGRDKTLEIMHDSTIGTYAVIALVMVILGQYAVFSSMLIRPAVLAIILASSRMGVLTSIHFFPTVEGSQLGALFKSYGNKGVYILQWIVLILYILWMGENELLILPLLAALFAYLFSQCSIQKIGGVSGDIYGALMELENVILLLVYGGFIL